MPYEAETKMKEINKLVKQILGKPMTKKEKRLLDTLRQKVKNKEITISQAHAIWNKMVKQK